MLNGLQCFPYVPKIRADKPINTAAAVSLTHPSLRSAWFTLYFRQFRSGLEDRTPHPAEIRELGLEERRTL